MNVGAMAWRYLWSRPLVTALTLTGIALGAALITGILTIREASRRALVAEAAVFDLVVGAPGSPLQLVLSSVYHLDEPTGNIPWATLELLRADERVTRAVPIALGDNLAGHRIIGTSAEFFAVRRPAADGGGPLVTLAEGRLFLEDFEAVVGAGVARRLGLRPGDQFVGSHGLVANDLHHHGEHPYTVVGILAPSDTANDRAVFVTVGSVWGVHGEGAHPGEWDDDNARDHEADGGAEHAAEQADDGGPEPAGAAAAAAADGHDHGADDHDGAAHDEELPAFLAGDAEASPHGLETTAVLVQLASPGLRLWLADELRRTAGVMAAVPLLEAQRLTQNVLAPLEQALLAVAWVVVVVAALSIAATLYQAAERRRREIAVLRCLGARPGEVTLLLLAEALFLAVAGVAAGWLLAQGTLLAAGGAVRGATGFELRPSAPDAALLGALGAVIVIGVAAGLLPAWRARRRPASLDLSGAG